MSFRLFATKRRLAKRQKDAMRKDDKIKVSNGVFLHVFFFFFSSFCAEFLSFCVAGFVFSFFNMALFRLFVFSHGIFSCFRFLFLFFFFFFRMASFCLFAWRLFAAKRQNDEMAQTSHHI